jgi:hypothetical protein
LTKAVVLETLPERPIDHAGFVAGEIVDFGGQWGRLAFTYHDPVWYALDALSPGRPVKDATYNFGRLPQWLVRDAKDCIASAWLERNLAAGTLLNYLKALVKLGEMHPDREGDALTLGRGDADALKLHLQRQYDAGRVGATACVNTISSLSGAFKTIRLLPRYAGRKCYFEPVAPRVTREVVREQKQVFSTPAEKLISDAALGGLVRACRADEEDFERVLRGEITAREIVVGRKAGKGGGSGCSEEQSMIVLRNRAIYAQVIKVAAAFGRRGSAISSLPLAPQTERRSTEAGLVLRLHIYESKINAAAEIARAVGSMADMAEDAFARARKYTLPYREIAGALNGYLFLLRGKGGVVGVPSIDRLNEYVGGSSNTRGLIGRRGVTEGGDLVHLTTHNFRTTRLTRIGESAGTFAASQDAGHRRESMTAQFYVVGTPKLKAKAEAALRSGAVSGEVAEALAAGHPIGERVSRRLIEGMMRGGKPLVVNITRYGLCFLQAETGPCPTGNPCWLGTDPDAPDIGLGRGCEWQGLSPDAVPALEADAANLLLQIELYAADDRYRHFVGNLVEKLAIVRRQLDIARGLARSLEDVEADPACA